MITVNGPSKVSSAQFSEYLPEIWQLLGVTMSSVFAQTMQNERIKYTTRQPALIQY